MSKTCKGTGPTLSDLIAGKGGQIAPNKRCTQPVMTHRRTWRFGDTTKGEAAIVRMLVPLCTEHAADWDECQAEAAAEGRAS